MFQQVTAAFSSDVSVLSVFWLVYEPRILNLENLELSINDLPGQSGPSEEDDVRIICATCVQILPLFPVFFVPQVP